VITTNFDSLTEDAIFMYTRKKPLVVSHESLAPYLDDSTNRPVIAKIHRDLMLHPFSDAEGTSRLESQWEPVLKNVFRGCSPIVIGYGGNDGSLMGFLQNAVNENRKSIPVYWCHLRGEVPNDTISELVADSGGFFIPIDGFDEAMYLFGEAFGHEFNEDELREHLEVRIKDCKQLKCEIEAKLEKVDNPSEDQKAIKDSLSEFYHKEIDRLSEQIETTPKNARLYYSLGEIYSQLHDYQNAIAKYEEALGLSPNEPIYYGARGLSYSRLKNFEKALDDYSKAIEIAPENAEYYEYRAAIYTELSNHDDAFKDMEKANALNQIKKVPVRFHKSCIEKIEMHFDIQLDKEKTTTYFSKSNGWGITCAVSKNYRTSESPLFWFAFHQLQKDFLEKFTKAYVSFGCGSSDVIFVLDYQEFKSHLSKMSVTNDDEASRKYWHIKIRQTNNEYLMLAKGDSEPINITRYKI